jgi:hypothetical protein
VQHGIAFAKETGAKIMVLTVTMPFHVFTLDPRIVETTSAGNSSTLSESAPSTWEKSLQISRLLAMPASPWLQCGVRRHADSQ